MGVDNNQDPMFLWCIILSVRYIRFNPVHIILLFQIMTKNSQGAHNEQSSLSKYIPPVSNSTYFLFVTVLITVTYSPKFGHGSLPFFQTSRISALLLYYHKLQLYIFKKLTLTCLKYIIYIKVTLTFFSHVGTQVKVPVTYSLCSK